MSSPISLSNEVSVVENSVEFVYDIDVDDDFDEIETIFECYRPSTMAGHNNNNDNKKRSFNQHDNDEILLLKEFIPAKSNTNHSNDVIFIESISPSKKDHQNHHQITNKKSQSRIDNYFRQFSQGNTIRGHENQPKSVINKSKMVENLSLLDPRLETLDPTPDLQCLFKEFDEKFFENHLGKQKNFQIVWCNRLTTSAGIFTVGYFGKRNGERRYRQEIRLSSKLLSLRPRSDLINTLLHEMIHAYIYFARINDNGSHGQCFQEFMYKINRSAGTNITIFHTFHDEVKYAQKDLVEQRNRNKRIKKNNQQITDGNNQSILDGWLIRPDNDHHRKPKKFFTLN
ncbi:DNA-dependent metalloprotease SPRTN [Dermatophagoides pteronyssinus]|uniref:DNA-dependent metalloprotease SPRTN n=1 Tax=Dermatophagoides pteronyssinus TaxID=6956 RepID=UPI003F676B87